MENDNGVVILAAIIIVSAFLLALVKLICFFREFNDEKRYILLEMHRAEDYDEYRYWRRELRCHYLCLIPFVTERNVSKVYRFLFRRSIRSEKEKRSDGLLAILAPSAVAVCICAVCLCGVSWAWFTASVETGAAAIHSAVFRIENVHITPNGGSALTLSADKNGNYTAEVLEPNTYALSFDAAQDNTSAKGYCRIIVFKNGEKSGTAYYTADIGKGSFAVTVKTTETVTVKLEPAFGDVKYSISEGTTAIETGSIITVGDPAENNTQKSDTAAVDASETDINADAKADTGINTGADDADRTTSNGAPSQTDTAASKSSENNNAPAADPDRSEKSTDE